MTDMTETNGLDDPSSCYRQGLEREAFFRQVSARGFGGFSKKARDPYHQRAWALWQALEIQSAELMKPVRIRNKVDPESTLNARIFGGVLLASMQIMPSITLRQAESSIRRFIPELEQIKACGPEEDQDILTAMVEHEMTLLRFIEFYNQGERAKAMALIESRVL